MFSHGPLGPLFSSPRLRFACQCGILYEDPDGILEISDGVTRATRIAKQAPGETVPVVVIGQYRRSRAGSPSVKDLL